MQTPPGPTAVAGGTAELLADADRDGSWMLLVNGTPQSHVDLEDPTHLEFEYVRRIGPRPRPRGRARAPLDVVHLGGGALTLPRYVAATRPGSRQRVVEIDQPLTDLVREYLPLPRGARIRVRARRRPRRAWPRCHPRERRRRHLRRLRRRPHARRT